MTIMRIFSVPALCSNQVQALKELKKEDLIAFFNQKIRCNGSERKKLSVHVFGNQHHRQLAIAKGEVTVPASYGNGVSNGHGTSNGHHLTSNGTAPVTTMADADSCKHLPTGQEVIEFPLKPDNLQHISSTLNGHSDQSGRTPIRIDNVQVFKRSQSFYCSPKVALWTNQLVTMCSSKASDNVWWRIMS